MPRRGARVQADQVSAVKLRTSRSLYCFCWLRNKEENLTKKHSNPVFIHRKFNIPFQSVRPVENSSAPLIVGFGVSLHQIVDLDEKNQILTTSCWLTQVLQMKDQLCNSTALLHAFQLLLH